MNKLKQFISVAIEVLNQKPILIHTSAGVSLYDENGIAFDTAIEFLFSLIHKRRDDCSTVFVTYDAKRENEFLFSTAPRLLKDKLFRVESIDSRAVELESENEMLLEAFHSRDGFDKEQAEFSCAVNRIALTDLLEVTYAGFKIKLVNGKFLQFSRNRKTITFYDIASFFGNPIKRLDTVANEWFSNEIDDYFSSVNDRANILCPSDRCKARAYLRTAAIKQLATKLNTSLLENGMCLSRYHGASALASHCLGKIKAKDEFYNYRYRRQYAPELWKATRQANYGGRAEQFVIGSVENVYVYDINSAYAHSITFLPKMLRKPNYVKEWQASPFSLWFCDYDFRSVNPFFGLLPNRDTNNATQYKLKGRGYFWQPEVQFILRHYPDCVEVKGGYVLDYERAEFAKGIETLFELRKELKRRGDPLERVLKLALASMYGKFCQHNGRSHYYNLFYAGFITSFTRMQLLEATNGIEQDTLCFQTDAIHSTNASLNIPIGDELGELRFERFDKITYLDNGVYRSDITNTSSAQSRLHQTRLKTRGFRDFDFDKALAEMQSRKEYSALVEFFVGHNLFSQQMFGGAPYLSNTQFEKITNPLKPERAAMRLFEVFDIDLSQQYLTSKTIPTFSGRESMPYQQNNFKRISEAVTQW